MSKIVLVEEGVFPIIKKADGSDITLKPETGWNIAGTVQGEGKLAGVPSLFIRFASCNLRCIWTLPNGKFCSCDTTYASFHPNQTKSWEIQVIVDTVKRNLGTINHVVITGGEPMLQKDALAVLCKELKNQCNVHITLETNGTIFDEEVAQYIDLASISPKLKNSVPTNKTEALGLKATGPFNFHDETRKQTNVIQKWILSSKKNKNDYQLKFVVAHEQEEDEIRNEFLNQLNEVDQNNVMLMPLGTNDNELSQTTKVALQLAVKNGWRYTPRIHIDIFGCRSGV